MRVLWFILIAKKHILKNARLPFFGADMIHVHIQSGEYNRLFSLPVSKSTTHSLSFNYEDTVKTVLDEFLPHIKTANINDLLSLHKDICSFLNILMLGNVRFVSGHYLRRSVRVFIYIRKDYFKGK